MTWVHWCQRWADMALASTVCTLVRWTAPGTRRPGTSCKQAGFVEISQLFSYWFQKYLENLISNPLLQSSPATALNAGKFQTMSLTPLVMDEMFLQNTSWRTNQLESKLIWYDNLEKLADCLRGGNENSVMWTKGKAVTDSANFVTFLSYHRFSRQFEFCYLKLFDCEK